MDAAGHEKCTSYMTHLCEVQEEVKLCYGDGGKTAVTEGQSGIDWQERPEGAF